MNQPWGEYERGAQSDIEAFVRHMLAVSGKSGSQLSRDLGRSSNFIWSTLQNKSTPRLDLFVKIANGCGYDVDVHGHGEEYTLAVLDGELGILSGTKATWEATQLLTAHMDEETAVNTLMICDEFCDGYDYDRMVHANLAGFIKEPKGYVFYDVDGKAVARCYHDASGEPKVDFYD